MRFRRKLGNLRLALWMAFGVVIAAEMTRNGHPWWIAAAGGIATFQLFFLQHLYWYWELAEDRLIHRRYFTTVSMPYADIVYAGPITGALANYSSTQSWIEIRVNEKRKMIAQPAKPAAFLKELHRHLPEMTVPD